MKWIALFFSFLGPVAIFAAVGYFLIWRVLPRGIKTTFVRELGSFFYSPIAYVCVVVFTILASVLSFTLGGFIERGDASLTQSFFTFHPWLFAFVAPAIGMRLWSEEHRQGTIELISTMPIAVWHVILGKFLAAAVVIWAALFCTFPALITMEILGDPDWGPTWTGYLASFLLATACLAITSAVSAFTRSQVIAFLVAVLLSVMMLFAGIPPVAAFVGGILPGGDSLMTGLGFWHHFMEMNKGLVLGGDLVYFLSITVFCLFTTAVVLHLRRA
jgi:ABC-2 type transport system permease protein